MSELRHDPLSKRWVIIATERGRRPEDYGVVPEVVPDPKFCPFCPGHEDKTPHEILAIRPPGSAPDGPGWSVRVIPNKYPALAIEGVLERKGVVGARFGYPAEGTIVPTSIGLFYPNWTASLGFSFPVVSSGRIKGDRMVAQANFIDAQERLQQAREAAELDARISINQYEQAQATYAASAGTDEQAAKAYQIAEVRFREGVSTQLELDQSRTQLQQARMNRVVAARDFELARLRLALLRDLPLASAGGAR